MRLMNLPLFLATALLLPAPTTAMAGTSGPTGPAWMGPAWTGPAGTRPAWTTQLSSPAAHQQSGHAPSYQPPKGPPPIFESGSSAIDIPFELSSNHIYLSVRIGTSATPAAILLDTGGGTSAFDPEVVKAAGIELGSPIRAMGAGGQTREAWLLGGVDYALPGVRLEDQSITAVSFRHLEGVTGRRMDGVLGADFLRQFVVIIDYAGRRLHLHDPGSFRYAGAGHPLPLTFNGPIPSVKAAINDTILAEFHVDTGARMSVKASRTFTERARLDDAARAVIEGAPGFGIGGITTQSVGRFEKLSLAGFEIPSPLVHLARDSSGFFGHSGSDGVIGGDVWRRFTMILDYPNRMMYLEPNADFADLFEYDMSGLALRADSTETGALIVLAVLPGSPAQEAGILAGDRIEGVDAKPARALELEAIRESFREPGRTVQITRRRGTDVATVTLTLRRLI
jgi:hypothetical protein